MTSRIAQITLDCRDPYAISRFWIEALGYEDDPANPNSPGDPEAYIVDPTRRHPALLFIPVPEPKTVKNRVHVDLLPDRPRDDEVDRLLAAGATLVDDQRRPDGGGWAVLADPEGNELCVERSAAERGRRNGPDAAPVAAGERDFPPVQTAAEQDLLVAMLDWYREGVVLKVSGASSAVARARALGSPTTIAGLVKHLALVEDSWFTVRFAGRPEPEAWAGADFDADPDWEFATARHEPLEDLVALYQAACARSREAVAGHGLDDLAVRGAHGRPFTLRFALTHLLEETARHLGHLDILRELLDGTTGE